MKHFLFFVGLFMCISAHAQYRDNDSKKSDGKFDKQRLFTGGSVNLGFSSYTTNLGIAPQLGISLTNWLDAGVNVNVNYSSERDYNSPAKWRKTTIGPGAFVRIFPISFLFATAQYEYNFITYRFISGSAMPNETERVQAPSLLLGLGYAGGRVKGSNSYYYFSVSADFLGHKRSPYIDGYERMIPVIRAGYNIGLFQGRNSGRF